jgi:hypothetical protein
MILHLTYLRGLEIPELTEEDMPVLMRTRSTIPVRLY